jgi:hypothetical protein
MRFLRKILMQGVEAVENILFGIPELTLHYPSFVNTHRVRQVMYDVGMVMPVYNEAECIIEVLDDWIREFSSTTG